MRAALIPVLLLTAACVTTSDRPEERDTGPWIEPSATLQEQIDDKVQRLPWTSGVELVELIHWFSALGEPGYPTLLQLCLDERPDVAGAALAALGATYDARLVEPLHQLDWPEDLPAGVRFERARTLQRLGDWSEVPVIISGLESDSLYVRAVCAKTLFEATNETFDYDARAEPAAREAAVVRWRDWWARRNQDPFLGGAQPQAASSARDADD